MVEDLTCIIFFILGFVLFPSHCKQSILGLGVLRKGHYLKFLEQTLESFVLHPMPLFTSVSHGSHLHGYFFSGMEVLPCPSTSSFLGLCLVVIRKQTYVQALALAYHIQVTLSHVTFSYIWQKPAPSCRYQIHYICIFLLQ